MRTTIIWTVSIILSNEKLISQTLKKLAIKILRCIALKKIKRIFLRFRKTYKCKDKKFKMNLMRRKNYRILSNQVEKA